MGCSQLRPDFEFNCFLSHFVLVFLSSSWCRRKDVQHYPGWNPLFTLNKPYIINFLMDLSCFYIALQFMRYISMAQFTPKYSLQRHNLPRTGGKLCHETTFF